MLPKPNPNGLTSVIATNISFLYKTHHKTRSNVNRCVYSFRKNGKSTRLASKCRHVIWFTSSLHRPQIPSNVFSIIWVAASQWVTRITATSNHQPTGRKSAGIKRDQPRATGNANGKSLASKRNKKAWRRQEIFGSHRSAAACVVIQTIKPAKQSGGHAVR